LLEKPEPVERRVFGPVRIIDDQVLPTPDFAAEASALPDRVRASATNRPS
jgi:hypothetical protein